MPEDQAEYKTDSNKIQKPKRESQIGGISLRGWLAALIVATVCAKCFLEAGIPEILAYGFSTAIGFFFGQKSK